MTDIYVGTMILWLAAVALFLTTLRWATKASKKTLTLSTVLVVAAIVCHAFVLRDKIHLARMLPFSNLIVVGNWAPLFVAVLAALAWRGIPGGSLRKLVTVLPLVLGCVYLAYEPLLGEPPACSDLWSQGVCMQTSAASCSAASAATLLRCHGISATEGEMAALCFTRAKGTSRHGLYRGLKLKTVGTPWEVEILSGDADTLRRASPEPVLLFVGLERGARVDPRYEKKWGWKPGVLHVVVLFRFIDHERIEIGDPAIGREPWPAKALEVLWQGEGLRLVRQR
ncbi:MAG: hypothetical protein HY318_18455 [Armatimonadetes bacterium]|nr:hypothetical protein [Armatimonadota bacterium]